VDVKVQGRIGDRPRDPTAPLEVMKKVSGDLLVALTPSGPVQTQSPWGVRV